MSFGNLGTLVDWNEVEETGNMGDLTKIFNANSSIFIYKRKTLKLQLESF